MSNKEIKILPRGCRIIDFPESVDDRGALSFAEGTHHIPFQIERVFWIYNVPEGKSRGNHSHNEASEVVVPVCGSFDIIVDDGSRRVNVHMDSSKQGILIPPGVWCELKNFDRNTVCMVFASHPYNAAGYINDYKQYLNEQLTVVRFDRSLSSEWDSFVKTSKNGTFLLERSFMDYHADRFEDCSLMFYKHGHLLALLPANWEKDAFTVQSHGGLTYGGLIFSKSVTAVEVLEIFSCAIDWMKNVLMANRWIYKPIPYIYSKLPSEEDLYALFRSGGKLKQRAVSSVIDGSNKLPLRQLRKRGQIKAENARLTVSVGDFENDIAAFWDILSDVLTNRHGKKPVHTIEEIRLLESRFPNEIKLYVVKSNDKIIAGTVVFETEQVAHAQYIAASQEGKMTGALDLLFANLITDVYADKPYFDFGVSTEDGGKYLNEGLIFQKEGFGGRSVVYDTYEIKF